MAESRCVICGGRKTGLAVQTDAMITLIRWAKKNILHDSRRYRPVVCKECYIKYKKTRDAYTKRRVLYSTIGIIFAVALIFGSSNKLLAIIYGAIVAIAMYLLSYLSYMPAVEMPRLSTKR